MPTETSSPKTPLNGLPRIVTVKDAITRYREQGEGSIYKGYRDVIKSLVKNGYDKAIRNDSYADALFLTDIMLEHTEEEFRMVGGTGTDNFISALKGHFRKMLDRLTRVGGKARIVVVRTPDQDAPACPTLRELASEYPNVMQFEAGVSDVLQRHYVVSDSQMIRIEEPHLPLSNDTDACAIKAMVYFSNPVRASMLKEEFDRVWNVLLIKR